MTRLATQPGFIPHWPLMARLCIGVLVLLPYLCSTRILAATPNPASQQSAPADQEDAPSLDGLDDSQTPTIATTDTTTDITGQIGIQQAVSLATTNDPQFQQINWEIEKAKGERLQATRYPNPSAGITGNEIGNDGSGGQYGVFWSETIVRNNRQALQQRYFSIAIAAMQRKYDVRRWQIARDIGTRFLTASRYGREHEIISSQIESLGIILKITEELFEAGEISRIAVSNIELEIDMLRQKLVELNLKQEFEIRALAIPLGAADSIEIEFDWAATVAEVMNQESTMLDDGWLSSHPQVSFASAEVEKSRWQIQLARSQRVPDVDVQGSLTYDTESDSVFAGFQVGRPVLKFDCKNGAIAAATAEYQSRLEGVRSKEMRLQSTYTIVEGETARLRSRVTNIREKIVPKAEKNLEQIREAFEIGEAEFLLVKTGLDQVLQSRIQLLEAEYELVVASIKLRTLLLDE